MKTSYYENTLKISDGSMYFKKHLSPYTQRNYAPLRRFGIFLAVFFTLFLFQVPAGIMTNTLSKGLMLRKLYAETPETSCMTILYSGDERGTIQPCG